ncbi:hypothetical protein EAL2_c10510 [Peptoclostridium acidaminophilum DSM 3953]|uniref:Division initiation protein n=1 Tax=Peptoclostridium acidaminophilum DSM 3953 TaxID=1286171 RepID=W8T3K3_PEPAC|nr:DUF881 domain-containing protein [Peptoclostridium acidaminophilum]AHM56349.1 hypothetical protein EAL2_c10510 [Peptoclostridium acidaminophilum DSM 3953]
MKKVNMETILLVAVMFVFGISISIQIKSSDPNNLFVTLSSIKELGYQIDSAEIEVKKLEELVLEKKKDIVKYEGAMSSNGKAIESLIQEEHDKLKLIAGMQDVKGPGIIVSLKDGERELEDGEDPNDILVHDRDVLEIVNDLKVAGAEAISINGERVISTSEIKCAGPTITINSSTYGQPFVINAIGEPAHLEAAMRAPDSYAYILKEVWGLDVKIAAADEINIAKYSGELNFRYVKEGE